MTHRHRLYSFLSNLNTQYIVLVLLVLVLLNVVAVAAMNEINYYQARESRVASIGQQYTINEVKFMVSDIKKETGYSMGIVPSSNQEIISLDLTIENNSKKDFSFYPSIQTFIRDNEGENYQMTIVNLDNPFGTNSVAPGETASGRLAYMVSSRDIPMKLYVESTEQSVPPFVAQIR